MITVARIDERMIHGQVAYAWPVAYKSDAILAVDDELAKDEMCIRDRWVSVKIGKCFLF